MLPGHVNEGQRPEDGFGGGLGSVSARTSTSAACVRTARRTGTRRLPAAVYAEDVGIAVGRRGPRELAGACFALLLTAIAEGRALADEPQRADAAPAPDDTTENVRVSRDIERAPPPPQDLFFLQYGVAFTTEQVVAAGPICDAAAPCVIGPGGGIAIRAGWRQNGPLYLGGAYELTKQDPNKLYRIALLQQARFEARYYFATARVTEPYVAASAGVSGYGNEWSIDSWGPSGSLGGGFEYQITRRTVVGLALAYRLLYLSGFVDTARTPRDGGVAQLMGLDLVLEQRDAVVSRR